MSIILYNTLMPLSIFALRERNLGILQRYVRGERTMREEAEAQNVRFQRIDQIIKATTKQLFLDLERTDVSRSDVLEYYRLTEDQVLKLSINSTSKTRNKKRS